MVYDDLPPGSLQKLRDTLINEGLTVPNLSLEISRRALDIIESIKGKIDKTLAEMSEHHEAIDRYRKACSLYQEAIDRGIYALRESDALAQIKCSYSQILTFLNVFKIIKNLSKRKKNRSEKIISFRNGFFFAFKENMKNTP